MRVMTETTTGGFDAEGGEVWQGIPVNAGDLPIDAVQMEESQVYPATLEKVVVASKLSKRGVVYCAVQVSIPEGDYEGMTVALNYLPLPIGVRSDATKKEKIAAQNQSAAFGRFCRSFKITGQVPAVSLASAESINRFHDFMSKFYGNRGKVMIRNQEFPEGSGRQRSGISDFVF